MERQTENVVAVTLAVCRYPQIYDIEIKTHSFGNKRQTPVLALFDRGFPHPPRYLAPFDIFELLGGVGSIQLRLLPQIVAVRRFIIRKAEHIICLSVDAEMELRGIFTRKIYKLDYLLAAAAVVIFAEFPHGCVEVAVRVCKKTGEQIAPQVAELAVTGGIIVSALLVNSLRVVFIEYLHIALNNAEIREESKRVRVVCRVVPNIYSAADFSPE